MASPDISPTFCISSGSRELHRLVCAPLPAHVFLFKPLTPCRRPGLRDEFIRVSQTATQSVHSLSFEIGQYLSVNIDTKALDLGGGGPRMLASQITDLKNWTLDEEFFKRHPHLRAAV